VNFGLAQEKKTPGEKPLVVNGVVLGPFKEEEEATSVPTTGRAARGGALAPELPRATHSQPG